MKCYYHQDKDAVGICYHCSRALCINCVKEYTKGLACSGRCEKAVESMLYGRSTQLNTNIRLLKFRKKAKKAKNISPLICLWLLTALFSLLIAGVFLSHFYIYSAETRLTTEIGLCGTIITFGIPTYLHYRRKSGGG
jgi:hypothetical protein